MVSLSGALQAGVIQEFKLCSPWVSGNRKVVDVSLWEQAQGQRVGRRPQEAGVYSSKAVPTLPTYPGWPPGAAPSSS